MGQQEVLTRASAREYREFFPLYSRYCELGQQEGYAGLADGKKGVLFLPLGFVPGEAIVLRRMEDGKLQRVDATPGVHAKIHLPAEPMPVGQLPEIIQQALTDWQALVQGVGRELSPWSMGLAGRLLQGEMPAVHLTVGFTKFQPPDRHQEVPFGISLIPDWGGVKVERVYNPANLLGVPAEGEVFLLEEIQQGGQNILAKALRTWTKMENATRRAQRDE